MVRKNASQVILGPDGGSLLILTMPLVREFSCKCCGKVDTTIYPTKQHCNEKCTDRDTHRRERKRKKYSQIIKGPDGSDLLILTMPVVYEFVCGYCNKLNTTFYSDKTYCDEICLTKAKRIREKERIKNEEDPIKIQEIKVKQYNRYKKYYNEHPEKFHNSSPEQKQKYYQNNKERYKERQEKFRNKNPNYCNNYQRRKRKIRTWIKIHSKYLKSVGFKGDLITLCAIKRDIKIINRIIKNQQMLVIPKPPKVKLTYYQRLKEKTELEYKIMRGFKYLQKLLE